jgi:hypothetical protein
MNKQPKPFTPLLLQNKSTVKNPYQKMSHFTEKNHIKSIANQPPKSFKKPFDLDLAKSKLETEDINFLAQILKKNLPIDTLVLSSCFLGESLIPIAEALASNKSLKTLVLFKNSLNSTILKKFSDALESNSTLTKILIDAAEYNLRNDKAFHKIQNKVEANRNNDATIKSASRKLRTLR